MTTNTHYAFSTPEHDFVLVPNPVVPDLVEVRASSKEALEEFIGTLELAGVSEGMDFSKLVIEEDNTEQDIFFYVEVSPATLAIYTQFEFLNYMGVTADVL